MLDALLVLLLAHLYGKLPNILRQPNLFYFFYLLKKKNEKYRHVYFSDDILVEGKGERCLSHTQTLKSCMPPNQNITEKLYN